MSFGDDMKDIYKAVEKKAIVKCLKLSLSP